MFERWGMLHVYEAQEDETQLGCYRSWARSTLANHAGLDPASPLALHACIHDIGRSMLSLYRMWDDSGGSAHHHLHTMKSTDYADKRPVQKHR